MSQNGKPAVMRPSGAGAVMQHRAARVIEADDAQRRRWRDLDFFPTPPWAARAGAELVLRLDPHATSVLEPACGEGHIAEPLRAIFSTVWATDIHHYGCNCQDRIDFLAPGAIEGYFGHPDDGPDWVITNPPFLKAAEFVRRGLEIARRGVAVLCRAAFLESAARYPLLFAGDYPLTAMAPFIERVPMQLGSWDPQGSTATAYAWFFFSKVSRASAPTILPIPPGTKARLTKPGDVERFGARLAMPLFQEEPDVERQ